ncbi:AbrB/MazE/SpoVT family DNA-binding domain-containing protein [Salibacterium halotolerans]|uniref:Putative addiction module antidote n=1 Tax=Salibacterium halotolerans TaxID=1884432 RepID=A0A1I5KW10_9BACI|nr:AbrB/MazE/SpoVT family DNA-binding domain-containing protein [Salibacterium halotolerans]SFO89255.1 putative addiction module antidote [Salibacterium halotolerans]
MSAKESRKVTQTGNSLSVGLPKSITDSLKIKRGDDIEFEVQDNKIVLNKKRKWEEDVDPEMLDMLAETFEDHHDVFEKLKDR